MSLNAQKSSEQRSYNHPYQPYDVQYDFMNAVYECLEQGKVGILESPTGTGKSLSLICSSLTWLREHKRARILGSAASAHDDGEPEWMEAHSRDQKRQNAIQNRRDLQIRLAEVRAKEDRARRRYDSGEPPGKKQRTAIPTGTDINDDEARYAPEDYESDTELGRKSSSSSYGDSGLSTRTQALMDKLGLSKTGITNVKSETVEDPDDVKIIFCSRTHSQLSQFINELRRVKLPPSIPPEDEQGSKEGSNIKEEELRHITLGSRKNLCINPKVSKLNSLEAINERCLEMQRPNTASDAKCPYLPNKENEVLSNDFKDHALARIRDIEDFGKLGKTIGICPYYATRSALQSAEIITLPYPLLLQKNARESLGLSLKNHIVIIDEAHNLMDAISSTYSVSITLDQLRRARGQIGIYLQKFRTRLKGKNRMYVTQLVRLIDSLKNYLEGGSKNQPPLPGLVQPAALLAGQGVDQVNLYKLMFYLQQSKLAHKVDGYVELDAEKTSKQQKSDRTERIDTRKRSAVPILSHIQAFLLALTSPAPEGRFFVAAEGAQKGVTESIVLKYMLLDPSQHFMDVAQQARALILAGGTMSPMHDYTNYLFHYLSNDKIQTLSCGHVIPASNLLALTLAKGPQGIGLDFTFEKRNSNALINDLGELLIRAASLIPDGLVVFFPSYAYLDLVLGTWKKLPSEAKTGTTNNTNIWDKLFAKKQIFVEPRSNRSSDKQSTPEENSGKDMALSVDHVLDAYTQQVHTGSGAVMLAVIGGSLSEGINFADKLGRGVVVVGLPFPNANSPEWKERLAFVSQRSQKQDFLPKDSNMDTAAASSSRPAAAAAAAGAAATKDFYENACMRAVNQSIGRAIRHKNDFAVIILLDSRYSRQSIERKLPGWIQGSLTHCAGAQDCFARIGPFFDKR